MHDRAPVFVTSESSITYHGTVTLKAEPPWVRIKSSLSICSPPSTHPVLGVACMHNAQPPTVIYLPSSGGQGGSRFAPELVTRKRFPFRRYSFQEDGSLVVRVKHLNRDGRPCPYTKPAVRFDTPPTGSHATPLPDFEPRSIPPTLTSTSASTVELLKNLVPALVEDPSSFEESISSICAAHNVDRTVISTLMQAAKRRSSSRPPGHTRTMDRSTPFVVSSSTSTPVAATVSLVPFKHERPFPSGHRGATIWYSTQSYSDVLGPPSGIPGIAGNLYIHKNLSTSTQQIWLFDRDARWITVSGVAKAIHPTIVDRVLSIRSDGSPNWVTTTGFTNVQSRLKTRTDV
ncbi:hypothetical protein BJ322DRAFT_1108084 [Thelephora terrestris]|uniref:Uncharacterized protein n=1 Tax=Thelephora terrestris TaxID=56493 RepID=A0A9P6HHP9_9AGAM|nr:hypothetical protein BJ322DRAFT_1108084 [Thelephora terrestris]